MQANTHHRPLGLLRATLIVSNSLDPDQAPPYVGPDLGPNCLQRYSADDETSRQRIKR